MPFIETDMDLDGLKEPQAVPESTYDLRCDSGEVVEGKGGGKNIRVLISIDGQPDAATIFHYISLPMPSDEEDKRKFKAIMLKRFVYHFKVEHDEAWNFHTEAIAGCTASTFLKTEEYEGKLGNKLVIPPLPEGV